MPAPDSKPAPAGHNSKINAHLLSIVERIENVDSEMKNLREDRAEIFKEAKGQGFDTAQIRGLVKDRAADPEKEAARLMLQRAYRRAIGMKIPDNGGEQIDLDDLITAPSEPADEE